MNKLTGAQLSRRETVDQKIRELIETLIPAAYRGRAGGASHKINRNREVIGAIRKLVEEFIISECSLANFEIADFEAEFYPPLKIKVETDQPFDFGSFKAATTLVFNMTGDTTELRRLTGTDFTIYLITDRQDLFGCYEKAETSPCYRIDLDSEIVRVFQSEMNHHRYFLRCFEALSGQPMFLILNLQTNLHSIIAEIDFVYVHEPLSKNRLNPLWYAGLGLILRMSYKNRSIEIWVVGEARVTFSEASFRNSLIRRQALANGLTDADFEPVSETVAVPKENRFELIAKNARGAEILDPENCNDYTEAVERGIEILLDEETWEE